MANWYWYNAKAGAATDGIFGSANWNAQSDAGGAWGTPGVGDTAFMAPDYGGGDGDDSDCNVAANVTIAIMNQAIATDYGGTFTIDDGVTLTVSSEAEWTGNLVITGVLTIADHQTFAVITGDGAIAVTGNLINSPGTDYSGYGGTFVWGGAGSQEFTSTGPALPAWVMNGTGTLTLDSDMSSGAISMTAGTLTLGTNTLTPGNISGAGGTINFNSATLELAGVTLNGANITFTCAGATANGGTITNVDLSGSGALLQIIPTAEGSGNQNVEPWWGDHRHYTYRSKGSGSLKRMSRLR